MLVFSAFMVIRIALDYRKGEDNYRMLDQQFVLPPKTPIQEATVYAPEAMLETDLPTIAASDEAEDGTPSPSDTELQPKETPFPTETPATTFSETAPISVDFDGLLKLNDECIGWIYIPDTSVSYPVMHANNNSKYLDKLPDGTDNKVGSIFMDFRCDEDLTDRNTIIYGHNMQNGSMFAVFEKYEKRSFFDTHRTVYYLTPDGDYKITVFACATVSATGESYSLYENVQSLHAYLKSVLKGAHVSAPVDADRIDRIITLSTCTGRYGTRIVLLGIAERLF